MKSLNFFIWIDSFDFLQVLKFFSYFPNWWWNSRLAQFDAEPVLSKNLSLSLFFSLFPISLSYSISLFSLSFFFSLFLFPFLFPFSLSFFLFFSLFEPVSLSVCLSLCLSLQHSEQLQCCLCLRMCCCIQNNYHHDVWFQHATNYCFNYFNEYCWFCAFKSFMNFSFYFKLFKLEICLHCLFYYLLSTFSVISWVLIILLCNKTLIWERQVLNRDFDFIRPHSIRRLRELFFQSFNPAAYKSCLLEQSCQVTINKTWDKNAILKVLPYYYSKLLRIIDNFTINKVHCQTPPNVKASERGQLLFKPIITGPQTSVWN